jgi:hypothetical protein
MNAHGGFIPATPAPMDALPPGQVMQDHRTEFNGGKKGDRTVPSFILSVFYHIP